jgi:hypothetical protein
VLAVGIADDIGPGIGFNEAHQFLCHQLTHFNAVMDDAESRPQVWMARQVSGTDFAPAIKVSSRYIGHEISWHRVKRFA